MATTPATLSVDEFVNLSWDDGLKRELKDGEIVEMPLANFGHEKVKSNANKILVVWAHQTGGGTVYPETGYKLEASTGYIPDVSFLTKEREAAMDITRIAQGAPDLAVEVVSSESAEYLETKIEDYLARGSQAVWVLYPEQRVIRVHDQTGASRLLREGATLEDLDLLPGFRVAVARFFEGLPAGT